MKRAAGSFLIVLLIVSFISCASGNPYHKVDEAAYQGEYRQGLDTIEKDKKGLYRQKDAVLYYLDSGMLSHYASDYK
jgi:hypothetical protein